MVRFALLGATALQATVVLGALTSQSLPARDEELRLVKTSEEDAGTWMTEEQKFEQLISKGIHFADITDTMVSSPSRPLPLNETSETSGLMNSLPRNSRRFVQTAWPRPWRSGPRSRAARATSPRQTR